MAHDLYIVTGTSRGIGQAIAEALLNESAEVVVHGVSRECSIQDARYHHHVVDLACSDFEKSFTWPDASGAGSVVLINNAGTLGDIGYMGEVDDASIRTGIAVNLVAPALLMNGFLRAYNNAPATKWIVNISSGAGKRPYDGWGMYCATKAGLDMFSLVTDLEGEVRSREDLRVVALSPGVTDTAMQEQIRNASKESFSRIDKFLDLKKEDALPTPASIAEKLIAFIQEDPEEAGVLETL